MEELLMCTVCCEQYQEKMRHPVLLPRCGHSFCRPCVAFLVKNGCVICPTCRMDQRVETADHLPTEFSLLAITSVQQVTKMEMCERHVVKLSFWCKTCSEAACGECLFEDHPTHSHKVIKSTTYILEMKEAVKDIAAKFVDALDLRERWYHQQVFQCTKTINDAIRTLSVLRRDMEDARDLMKGAKIVEGIAPTTALSDASKCLALKWNLKDCNLDLSRTSGIKKEKIAKEEKEEDETETTTKPEDPGDGEGKADDEREKDTIEKEKDDKKKENHVDEPETLTEEERKKRKMQRVKEKLAAAAAAAEKATAAAAATEKVPAASKDKGRSTKQTKDDRTSNKEKTDVKEKAINSNEQESALTVGAAKTRSLARKYAPVPREPSVTPEREVSTPGNSPSAPREKVDKEDQHKETNENRETDVNFKAEDEAVTKREADIVSNSEWQPSKKEDESTSDKGTESPPSSLTDADSKTEGQAKVKKEPTTGVTKKPRGRLARQALKRSQTMNLASPSDDRDADDATKNSNSDNIRGLDLETTKFSKNEEPSVDNKDIEEQAKNEEKETEEKTEEQQEDKEDEMEQEETTVEKDQAEKPMFEMEPEEKERITTELMQVPSLTVIVEGIGGRLACLAWEPMGLHVYCHQYQELPYDVIIKSTVLHSLILTKSPMVFLDVGSDQKVLGRVYISLWGHLRRAANFLHLCLGDRGPSYRNTMFLEVLNPDCPGERIKGGDYDYNNGRGGEALLDDLEFQEGYSMPMEAGTVTAGAPCKKEQDSQFFICTEDDLNRNFACPFGRVVSGLYVMKEAVWLVVTRQMWIRECGVVLDVPRF